MSLGDFIKNPTQSILKHTVDTLDNEDGKNDKGVMDALFSNPSLLRISTKNSKQQIYPKEYRSIELVNTSNTNNTGIQIFSLVIGIIAAVLSWYSNPGYTTLERIFFSVFAFFFGILYLFYYFIVRYNETRILNNL
jgi:hypothetical protein